jgi:hypothetical protein
VEYVSEGIKFEGIDIDCYAVNARFGSLLGAGHSIWYDLWVSWSCQVNDKRELRSVLINYLPNPYQFFVHSIFYDETLDNAVSEITARLSAAVVRTSMQGTQSELSDRQLISVTLNRIQEFSSL